MSRRFLLGCAAVGITLFVLFCALSGSVSKPESNSATGDLIVYAEDAFMASDGLGPEIVPLFEKQENCKVQILLSGHAGQILNRLEVDTKRLKLGQVVVGIDQYAWRRMRHHAEHFLPYAYGPMSFIVNRDLTANVPLPRSLKDLLKTEWRRNVILQDPRTSTPGLAFLLFTRQVFGEKVWDFWSQMRQQWLTLAPGWGGAYGLFLKGEAPLVWSYVTSQAYHRARGVSRYQAVPLEEGQPLQIEGAFLVREDLQTERQKILAKRFLEFLISPEVQGKIPNRIWLFPVLATVNLPASYIGIESLRSEEQVQISELETESETEIDAALLRWAEVAHGSN